VYPLGAVSLAPAAFAVHAILYLLYYTGFEFHYRGFLLLGLREHLGAAPANLLQAGLATLVHLGKPHVELVAVIPASLLFGWIALRTRSIWYAVAIHWVVGVALDYCLLAR
jgi:membrane protease YdiL (CAAX protease family)